MRVFRKLLMLIGIHMGKPKTIAIDHDDHHASHVGQLPDGRQFFLTTPFVPSLSDEPGREFVALFLFDAKGSLLEAIIDDIGPRTGETLPGNLMVPGNHESPTAKDAEAIFHQRLNELSNHELRRIVVKPFEIERYGISFGLIACAPEEDDEGWSVEMQPGNYMAFYEPWDSGDYDT